jgi:hypothetical protein
VNCARKTLSYDWDIDRMLSEKAIQGGTILPGEPLPIGEIMERLFQPVRKKLSFNILSVRNRQSPNKLCYLEFAI